MSAVRSGVGCTIANMGDLSSFSPGGFAPALPLEPPIYLTCSVISSGDSPLTHAGENVQNVLIRFLKDRVRETRRPGAEWIG